ncbi:hypothetical protein DL96DRAFT_775149 [Flagelloscypha sp. PMI_526]|nr:hypothetical protein DL96DRAFT_775149 [Flagelloscypha sp. PMI_526]
MNFLIRQSLLSATPNVGWIPQSDVVSTTLNVECLTEGDTIKTTMRIDVPLDTSLSTLAALVQPAIDLEVPPDDYNVSWANKLAPVVTSGPSNYNPTASSRGLKININEPLISWYKAYRRFHGLVPTAGRNSISTARTEHRAATKGFDVIEWQESSIEAGPATLRFHRTLRVPDDATNYALPPGLGTFPLVKAQDYSSSLPDYIATRGGYIMPLFQREAMWIQMSGGDYSIALGKLLRV